MVGEVLGNIHCLFPKGKRKASSATGRSSSANSKSNALYALYETKFEFYSNAPRIELNRMDPALDRSS